MKRLIRWATLAALLMGADTGWAIDFQFPLSDYRITGYDWGQSTSSGIHMGEDAHGGAGTPVYASGEGWVKHARVRTGYGLVVIIEHGLCSGDPYGSQSCTLYGHMRDWDKKVSEGQWVTKGQLLGYLGTSAENGGWTPHLHYAVFKGGYSTAWIYYGYDGSGDINNTWRPSDFIRYNHPQHCCSVPGTPGLGGTGDGALLPRGTNPTLCASDNGGSPDPNTYIWVDGVGNSGWIGGDCWNPGSLGSGAYTWHAKKGNSCGESGTATRTFRINHAPGKPGLIAPASGAALNTRSVTVSWGDPGDPDNAPNPYRDYRIHAWKVGGGWEYDSGWGVRATSLTLNLPADGEYRWQVAAGDGMNDDGYGVDRGFVIDTVAPAITPVDGPPVSTWFRDAKTITWTVDYGPSGAGSTLLRWDNGQETPLALEGKHAGAIYATDRAGNEAGPITIGPYWRDITPPNASLSSAPPTPDGENGWYVTTPILTAAALDPNGDDGSGVAAQYIIMDGNESPYTGPVPIPNGTHTAAVRAVDLAGNQTETPIQSLNVDTTPPVFPDPPEVNVYGRTAVTIELSAVDGESGVAGYEYAIGTAASGADVVARTPVSGASGSATEADLALAYNQTYHVTVWARNTAGASTSIETTFIPLPTQYDDAPNFNAGGVTGDAARVSEHYRIVDSLGQFAVETSASENYIVASGYWHADTAVPPITTGQVYSWGSNASGQLGTGGNHSSNVPVPVSGLLGVVAVSGSRGHSLALTSDGSVWAFGSNTYGQLGTGDNEPRITPVKVSYLSDVKAISAGGWHSLALTKDGSVWAWGYNDYGQLGTGNSQARNTPTRVTGLPPIRAIGAGHVHSVAAGVDGTVWAFGFNASGQLGNNTTVDAYRPVQVVGLASAVSVAAGRDHSLALMQDGSVRAWGDNTSGQIGDNTTTRHLAPVKVLGLSNVHRVRAGLYHSLAITSGGTLWAWGDNTYGELGTVSPTNSPLPAKTADLTEVAEVEGGTFVTVALRSDGSVWTFGSNDAGQLGTGSMAAYSRVPAQVAGLTKARAVAAGHQHVLIATGVRPITFSDVARVLRVAGGLIAATPEDTARLETTSSVSLTLEDAVDLARRAIGLGFTP